MRRIIVILVLIVLVFALSGCNKIKAELERRHLGTETQKETSNVTPQSPHAAKTFHVKRNDESAASTRRQVVIRIDLPIDEKIQIRLVKNSESTEELNPGDVAPSNDVSNEAAPPKDEVPRDGSGDSVESDKKTDSEERPQTTDPALAPTIIVPEKTTASPPIVPETDEIPALSQVVQPDPAPAEKAVGSALIAPLPSTISPSSNSPPNGASATNQPASPNPWAIPNADYPLRYY